MNYRKPQDLKVLTGTFRPDRDHANPLLESDLPEKVETPSHLGSAGKRQWRKLVKLLRDEDLLKKVDLGCLEACCLAYDEMVQSSYDMKTHRKKQEEAEQALTCVDGPDDLKAQLALIRHHSGMVDKSRSAKNKAMQLYHKFMNEFGLSPGSRIRLDLNTEKEEPSEFEQMFSVKSS
ncbi:MAG: phage terminase small subunit P27 family [Spirochaetales bacterium]|nr:phage terminase small subunit P27 family [Spirochaetales bacterium]